MTDSSCSACASLERFTSRQQGRPIDAVDVEVALVCGIWLGRSLRAELDEALCDKHRAMVAECSFVVFG